MSSHAPRVLVIDDDPDTREAVRDVLREEGYVVESASDGDLALSQLREQLHTEGGPPAVILLDLMMPVMDGIAFRAEQLADPDLCHIPVAVFSAHARAEEAAAALNADAYLEKPLSLEDLLATVRRLAERAEAALRQR